MNNIKTKSFEAKHQQFKDAIVNCAGNYISGCNEELDDMIQDVLLKIWTNWDRLETLPTNELRWMVITITRNHLINACKRANRLTVYQRQYSEFQNEFTFHDEILVAEGLKVYKNAIECLSPAQKLAYQVYENDFRIEEVAFKLRKSKHTLRNQITGAFQLIQQYLNEHWDLNFQVCAKKREYKVEHLN